jgi:hypothetical protein
LLSHIFLSQGKTLIVFPKFDLEVFLKNIQQHRIERLPIVPPIVLLLAKHPLVKSDGRGDRAKDRSRKRERERERAGERVAPCATVENER